MPTHLTTKPPRQPARAGLAVAACLAVSLAGPAIGATCYNWNTEGFFQTSTVKEVTDCLKVGADLNARNEMGRTPCIRPPAPTITRRSLLSCSRPGPTFTHWTKGATLPCIWRRRTKNPGIITALLEAEADLNGARRRWCYSSALGGRGQRKPKGHHRLVGVRGRSECTDRRWQHPLASGGLQQHPKNYCHLAGGWGRSECAEWPDRRWRHPPAYGGREQRPRRLLPPCWTLGPT